MSGPNVKSVVTHDSFGEEPAVAANENVTFLLKWKNSGKGSWNDLVIPAELPNGYNIAEKRDWNNFKKTLNDVASLNGLTIAERVTYVDSDDDEIPIESQCEFDEAVKFARIRATKKQGIVLIVGNLSEHKVEGVKKSSESTGSADLISLQAAALQREEISSVMPPMQLDNGASPAVNQQMWQSKRGNGTQTTQVESTDEVPPKWFTNYMQTMKEDIVSEVSKRVTKTVMDALHKKRENQYDSASPLVSDLEDESPERYSIKLREPRINLVEKISSSVSEVREKRGCASSAGRSSSHRFENSRRRYRHADKQSRKKHNKNHGLQTLCNDETWYSPSLNRCRGEKSGKKRDMEEARALPRSAGNSELSEQYSTAWPVGDAYEDVQELTNNSYRRIATPDPPNLLLENEWQRPKVAAKVTEEKLRMGCSVTGQDMLERPNDRVPEYDALSDSDNISIISDVSHASDTQRMNNSFEMIVQQQQQQQQQRSMNLSDEVEDNLRMPLITTEFAQADLDTTRDSSSFELLSEPPSPALSIHMDEDHFSPGASETEASNYNMNDDTTLDKRGNQSKIEICPYAIDAQGKIYQQNIIDGDATPEEIVLEKRTGGAYSFVGEALPGSTKESVIITAESRSEEIDQVADPEENVPTGTNVQSQTAGNSSAETFHESTTQSFNSHTSPHAQNDRNDLPSSCFASSGSRDETPGTPRSHVFVDRNASKGLGDTRRSSPRKPASSEETNGRSERPRSARKSANDSHASGNRNGNSRQGDRPRKFGNSWSTTRSTRMMDDLVFNAVDPMHILPETLVTGAVHVASSAYTTARRVYDKILTAQTRKPADKSKFGRR